MKLGITRYDENGRLSVEVRPRNVLNMVLQDVWHQMSWEKTYRFPVTTLPGNRGPGFSFRPYLILLHFLPAALPLHMYQPGFLKSLLSCAAFCQLWSDLLLYFSVNHSWTLSIKVVASLPSFWWSSLFWLHLFIHRLTTMAELTTHSDDYNCPPQWW